MFSKFENARIFAMVKLCVMSSGNPRNKGRKGCRKHRQGPACLVDSVGHVFWVSSILSDSYNLCAENVVLVHPELSGSYREPESEVGSWVIAETALEGKLVWNIANTGFWSDLFVASSERGHCQLGQENSEWREAPLTTLTDKIPVTFWSLI